MPENADIVVVGGGVVGCATAYYLAGEGLDVTLIERDSVASHSSGFAYGGLTPVMGVLIDDPLVPLSYLADELHAELATALPEEVDVDTQYRRRPGLILALDASEVQSLRSACDWLVEHHEGAVSWMDRDALHRLEPRVAKEIPAGMYTELSHEVEPYRFTLALAQAAEKRGATIRHASVSGLEFNAKGVVAVRAGSHSIHTETVVLAMGPWTGEAADWLGVPVAISPLKGQIIRLAAPGRPLELGLSWTGNYATTKPDGLVWAGTTEEEAGFDESPTSEGRDQISASLLRVLPYLESARLAQQTACLRPVAPDGLPVIGEAPGAGGVYVATGAGRKGIFLGPAMGKVTADLIIGRAPAVNVEPLGLARFLRDDGE